MAFAFKIRRKKFMYKARPWRRRSKRYKLYLYRSTTNRVVFKYWYKDKIFGYKWKWYKILKRIKWGYRKKVRLKKKEYFMRLYWRHLRHKYRLKTKQLKHPSFLAHDSFWRNRLVQVINATRAIKYFKLGRVAVMGGRVAVNNHIIRDVNYVIKPFDTIFFYLDRKYLRNRFSRWRRKVKLKKKTTTHGTLSSS